MNVAYERLLGRFKRMCFVLLVKYLAQRKKTLNRIVLIFLNLTLQL